MRLLHTALLLLAFPFLAAADDAKLVTHQLFNGKDVEGWVITGCEVTVDKGVLKLAKGDGYVRHPRKWKDFELHVEWRALQADKYDSGIYIRSELPPEGKLWPNRYQVNLLDGGEGNLLGIKGAVSKGLIKKGEWNRFVLKVVGDTAEMQINDKPAWKAAGLQASEGYIGLQSEVPKGGQFEFRKIELIEIARSN